MSDINTLLTLILRYFCRRGLLVFQGTSILLFGRSASWHLAVISCIKCYTIVRPMVSVTTMTTTFEAIVFVSLWLWNSVYGTTAIYQDYGMMVHPVTYYVIFTNPTNIPLWVGLASSILCTAIIFMANAIIFHTVYKQKQRMNASEVASHQTQSAIEFVASVKASKNILIICIVFGVTFLPSFVALFIVQVQPVLPVWYIFLCHWGFMCHAFTDTLLYMVLHRNVRNEIRLMFGCAAEVASGSEHR